MSTIFCNDNDGASFENTKHGVNKSTFNADITFWPLRLRRPVCAAMNPAKQIITTSTTASNVKVMISHSDRCGLTTSCKSWRASIIYCKMNAKMVSGIALDATYLIYWPAVCKGQSAISFFFFVALFCTVDF